MIAKKIVINEELCIGCQACIDICPRVCFTLNEHKKSVFESTKCHDCGHCISICSEQAISHVNFPGENYTSIKDSLNSEFLNGDQFYFLLKSIRSTRSYLEKPIETKLLDKLLDVTRYAPTGHHSQNVEIITISDQQIIQQIKDESAISIEKNLKKMNNPFIAFFAKLVGKGKLLKKAKIAESRLIRMLAEFGEDKDSLFHFAPLIVIFHGKEGGVSLSDNCNQAAAYFRVLAHAYSLGTCYIGYLRYFALFNKRILELISIPKGNQIQQTVIVGYPKHKFRTFVARKPSKIIHQ
ncbi:MAG: nitroreductase family protein [Candidatus Heimdallarchaeota archaeon]